MMAGKAQAGQQPTAMGSMLQAATYGNVIPVNMGITLCPLNVIWANNIRQGGSNKKGKIIGGLVGGLVGLAAAGKKGGPPTYVENIDFLLGKNPILGVLQMWANGGKYPLTIASQTFGYRASSTVTISDPYFYAVIAVTMEDTFSQTFNDYGNPNGSQTLTGSWEVPFWNELLGGPDPTNATGPQVYPYVYQWQPSYGSTFYLTAWADGVFNVGKTFKVYYAQMMAATSYQPPMSRLRLSFENVLGSGSEYSGFASEQIQYPWYAGMGSPDIDLGSTGTIPQLNAEVQGKYTLYPTGDCDFTDMIQEVCKSGITQAALGGTVNFGPTQHGVGCFDFPGCIQKRFCNRFENNNVQLAFNMPNTAGNVLVAYVETENAGTAYPVVSDTNGNTWTLRAQGTVSGGYGVVYTCENCKAGQTTVQWTNGGFYGTTTMIFELAGVDTFDQAASVPSGTMNPSVSITTTNAPGMASYIMVLGWGDAGFAPLQTTQYPIIMQPQGANFAQGRVVYNPGTYSISAFDKAEMFLMISWKATKPPTYPNPLPNFLEPTTLALMQQGCRAGGLYGSLSMNSQKPARDWLNDFYQAGNAAPVMSGFSLKSIFRSEVSACGNGAVYNAPTASGPVAELDVDKGDFICNQGESPIVIERAARTDLNTVVQMQHLNRTSDYQQVITAVSDAASILKYGVRKADPVVNNAIQDVSVARAILTIQVRRQNYIEPISYKFTLSARNQLLEAMDLITITDTLQGINAVPVRLTSAEQDDKNQLVCEAEPFMYGIHAPQSLSVDNPTPYSPVTNTSAGNVNTPIIFEPVPRLYNVKNQQELWIVVSSSNANYGGCQVIISTDGGLSYNVAGNPLQGSAITGVSTADWPAATSPDTTNDLAVDLTESNGELASYQTSDEDNFLYPCYIAGGGAYSIPYELMTYATATLTATSKYTLKATGTGNHLDRGVFGAPDAAAPGTGVDHPLGSRFAFLSPSGQGILKLTMDPTWIGKTLYFKCLSFNTFGGGLESQASATAYSYTPTGNSGSVNPGGIPAQGFQVNGA